MQCQRECERVGAGVRNVQVLAQRGDVRLATRPVQSLGHIEDDVGTGERKFLRQEFVGFETNDGAKETQSLIDRVDGRRVIPFCVGIRRGRHVGFLVVCETNPHVSAEYEMMYRYAREKRREKTAK